VEEAVSGAPPVPAGLGGPVTVTTVPDAEALALALVERFVAAAREAVRRRGVFRVALAGGTTPQRAYELLAALPAGEVPWAETQVFFGDERPVPPDHPDSNYRMAWEALLSRVPVPPAHVHRLRGEAQDLDAAAAEYAEELAYAFGIPTAGPPPRFDLVLLGMGAEGHTASLFPGSPVLASHAWVAAPFVPQLGMRRLTLTPWVLNAAERVVFAVSGTNKASALAAVLRGPHQPERYPAQAIRPVDGRLEWLVDAALARAAGLG
jgi:6-phosphogluconolactonase